MASREEKRLKVPETDHDFTCLEFVRSKPEIFQNDEELVQAYGAKHSLEMRELLMLDLLGELYSDPKRSPTKLAEKSKIISEFVKITGCVKFTAYEAFKKMSKQLKRVQNIGLLVNYAAVVKTDIIQKLYEKLLESDKKKLELVDKTAAEIKLLNPLQKPLFYDQELATMKLLLEAAESITTMGTKQDVNVINEDKNKILEKRVANEGKLGAAVALHIEGKSREEKERMLTDALLANKAHINPLIDQFISIKPENVRRITADEATPPVQD